jgi:hypothetical protein
VISRSHTALSSVSTFVRFSDYRRFFVILVVMLFVLLILVIIVVWVLRWQSKGNVEAQIDSPSGDVSRDVRYHLGGLPFVSDICEQVQDIDQADSISLIQSSGLACGKFERRVARFNADNRILMNNNRLPYFKSALFPIAAIGTQSRNVN